MEEQQAIKFLKILPTTLIYWGANFFGEKIAKSVASNGGNVIIIDSFSRNKLSVIRKLKEESQFQKGEIKMIDVDSVNNLEEILPKVNFSIFLGNFFIPEDDNLKKRLNSIENFIKISRDRNSKICIVININTSVNKDFGELSNHIYNFAITNIKSFGGVLVKIGEIYGEDMNDFIENPINQIVHSIKNENIIKIDKEHEFYHYIYIDDAISGIMPLIFTNNNGEYYLSDKEDISNISLCFRISDITGIKVEKNEGQENNTPTREDRIKTISNLPPEWVPKTRVENGLERTIQAKLESLNKKAVDVSPILTKNVKRKSSSLNRNINLSDFDKIKKTYLKNEYLNKEFLGENTQKARGKIRKKKFLTRFILFLIIYIVIITPLFVLYMNSYFIGNGITMQQYFINKGEVPNAISVNKQTQNEINIELSYIGILSFLNRYIPQVKNLPNLLYETENINLSLLKIENTEQRLNVLYATNLSQNNVTVLKNIKEVTSEDLSRSLNGAIFLESNVKILRGLSSTDSEAISTIKNYITSIKNNVNLAYTYLSGNKKYTLLYISNNNKPTISGTVTKISLIDVYNGEIVKKSDYTTNLTIKNIPNGSINTLSQDILQTLDSTQNTQFSGVVYINDILKNTDITKTQMLNFYKYILNKEIIIYLVGNTRINS